MADTLVDKVPLVSILISTEERAAIKKWSQGSSRNAVESRWILATLRTLRSLINIQWARGLLLIKEQDRSKFKVFIYLLCKKKKFLFTWHLFVISSLHTRVSLTNCGFLV